MGQYFLPVILTKDYKTNGNEIAFSVLPWNFKEGAKLTEHAWTDSHVVQVIIGKLKNELYGNPLVWCGDYAEYEGTNLYDKGKELADGFIKGNHEFSECRYVVNLDTKEYVEVPKETSIHPLPILTAVGNGESNSDYYGTCPEYVGKWAYHRIGTTDEKPSDDYSKLNVCFKE